MRSIVARGYAPTVHELAQSIGAAEPTIEDALQRLEAGHGLVLHPGTLRIWIAHPFSLSPTAVWIATHERGWWAPCLWCAAGIVALCAPNATIHVRLGGEGEEVRIALHDGQLTSEDVLVHFSVPPREAWANVVHFCASILPFRSPCDVDGWCARHRIQRGAVMAVSQLLNLGRAWYGQHLDETWRKWTVGEASAIFAQCGLRDEFWSLPLSAGSF